MVNISQAPILNANRKIEKEGRMKGANKKLLQGSAGNRVYPSFVFAACLGVFVIAVSFRLYRVVLCAVEHLVL